MAASEVISYSEPNISEAEFIKVFKLALAPLEVKLILTGSVIASISWATINRALGVHDAGLYYSFPLVVRLFELLEYLYHHVPIH